MIGILTLIAFILGLGTEGFSAPERIKIAQTMAFTVLALSELVHVFNIRNNKKSMFASNPFNNGMLILAIIVSASFMFAVLLIPALRDIFSIALLPASQIEEVVCLVFAPIVIVEIFKLLRLNGTKLDEK